MTRSRSLTEFLQCHFDVGIQLAEKLPGVWQIDFILEDLCV